MNDNPLSGFLNEAEKQMGSELYAANVKRAEQGTTIEKEIHDYNVQLAKHRMNSQTVILNAVIFALLPFWILAVAYGIKVVF